MEAKKLHKTGKLMGISQGVLRRMLLLETVVLLRRKVEKWEVMVIRV